MLSDPTAVSTTLAQLRICYSLQLYCSTYPSTASTVAFIETAHTLVPSFEQFAQHWVWNQHSSPPTSAYSVVACDKSAASTTHNFKLHRCFYFNLRLYRSLPLKCHEYFLSLRCLQIWTQSTVVCFTIVDSALLYHLLPQATLPMLPKIHL